MFIFECEKFQRAFRRITDEWSPESTDEKRIRWLSMNSIWTSLLSNWHWMVADCGSFRSTTFEYKCSLYISLPIHRRTLYGMPKILPQTTYVYVYVNTTHDGQWPGQASIVEIPQNQLSKWSHFFKIFNKIRSKTGFVKWIFVLLVPMPVARVFVCVCGAWVAVRWRSRCCIRYRRLQRSSLKGSQRSLK